MRQLVNIVLFLQLLTALKSATADDDKDECLKFVSREEWKAPTAISPANNLTGPLEYVFIHHTAGAECTTQHQCSVIMRNIWQFHVKDRGWDDIGYSFLIGGDGKVYVGRGWEKEGAHTYGYNRVAYGISLMGNYMDHPPSEIMMKTAKKLIAYAVKKGYVVKDYALYGHRDGRCTECPGDAFYSLLGTWDNWHAKGPIKVYC